MLAFCNGDTPNAVATLSGYAGVGKTTVVAAVVSTALDKAAQCALEEPLRVVVAAPTHKALAVLAERLGGLSVEMMTLHALLGLRMAAMDDGSQGAREEPGACSLHEYNLAIIDESSMIGPALFEAVLSKRGRCRVLFVGDPAQLPPVEDSESLSPAFGPAVPQHWALTEVVRQALNSPIIRLASAARASIQAGRPFDLSALGSCLVAGDSQFLSIHPGTLSDIALLVADAIKHGQDTRALAWDNATVQSINTQVHALVYPGQGEYPVGSKLLANEAFNAEDSAGRTRRTPVRNSALLTVVSSAQERHPDEPDRPAWRLQLRTESGQLVYCWAAHNSRQWQADISALFGERRRIKLREQAADNSLERQALRALAAQTALQGWALRNRFAPLRYAYAMTVHKSQGSTFDAVVIDWASFQRCADVATRNRLIYVALTRTRRFVVVAA